MVPELDLEGYYRLTKTLSSQTLVVNVQLYTLPVAFLVNRPLLSLGDHNDGIKPEIPVS